VIHLTLQHYFIRIPSQVEFLRMKQVDGSLFGDVYGDNLKEHATGLTYQPRLQAVVTCDYTGFVEPEMVKVRSVVVLAKSRTNGRLITVVPLSTTPPDKVLTCHHKLSRNPHPDEDPELEVWAKCDMVYTVSLSRVNYYKTKPRRGGRATYHSTLMTSSDDFRAIQRGTRYALGLDMLPGAIGAVVEPKKWHETR
jgi:uncharacterized protein YifN (PemK superfamily)